MKKNLSSLQDKTILQVLPNMDVGGIEQGTLQIVEALHNVGARALVVCHGGRLIEDVVKRGGEVITLPVHSKNPLVMLKNIHSLKRLITKERVDLVHARSRAPAWSSYWASKSLHIPFLTTFHGTYNFHNPFKKFYNKIMTKGDRVIAISNFIGQHIEKNYGLNHEKIDIIWRGIDLEVFDPKKIKQDYRKKWGIPADHFLILMVGRLTRWKGQKVLLEALSHLTSKKIACVFLGSHQGREAYKLELENYTKHKRLEHLVRFVENDAMPAAYSSADLIVHASTDPEAFGRVVAEAQAMEKPVIASCLGGPKEIIKDGETGWLIEPNDPKALATVIELALNLKASQRQSMGKKGRQRVRENFSKESMCAKTLAVYAKVLGTKA
ncbi:glycosyltransferase family 4 protein [Candidatus Nucleicultrix amoebiphila]|uniref:Glycosyl transferase n=1 Tax=Candidatus Nucleicultrix amoebiphila FS5 TaxID=1414854 RepID=A0A1W6N4B5_9PROT|nr:glycosyltransferase family 4 protein [Candidatus Nucleicultrix amoebiphila]ARN84629.1 hypothetical protein GQ61_04130 [Candidatus Nucleicultrix amoebiphila FS5]